MSLAIRPVDPWDEHEIDVLQEQYVEAHRAEVPDARVLSRADSVTLLRSSGSGGTFTDAFAALDGDTIVGQVWTLGSTTDNLHQAHLLAWVPPRYGRRGVGAALVRHAEEHLRGLGRRTAVTQTWLGRDGRGGYRRFAERLGYTLANTQIERRQRLPIDEVSLARLEQDAAAHAAAYEIQTLLGPIPSELAQGYCDLHNLLNLEMPSGELEVEEGRQTPEELAEHDEEVREAGRTRVTAMAFAPNGAMVAYSDAASSPPDLQDRSVDQWSTLVHPGHRGHRLGLAVKCALTRAIQENFPDVEYVRTQNAETNAPMVAINEAMGFEVHSIQGEFQRHLTG